MLYAYYLSKNVIFTLNLIFSAHKSFKQIVSTNQYKMTIRNIEIPKFSVIMLKGVGNNAF